MKTTKKQLEIDEVALRHDILEAIGTASVCWTKDGVFDSTQAIDVADRLFIKVKSHFIAKAKED